MSTHSSLVQTQTWSSWYDFCGEWLVGLVKPFQGQLGHVALCSCVALTLFCSRYKILSIKHTVCHRCSNQELWVYVKCLQTCIVLPSQNCFLPLWKDALYRHFPQKELWNTNQMGYTLVSLSPSFLFYVSLLFIFWCVFSKYCSSSFCFFYSFFLSVSPHKGLQNPMLQATQVE